MLSRCLLLRAAVRSTVSSINNSGGLQFYSSSSSNSTFSSNANDEEAKSESTIVKNAAPSISLSSQSLKSGFMLDEQMFKTNEADPTHHTALHEGQFYVLPADIKNKLFAVYNWQKHTHEAFDVLDESAIMIRQPALQLMNIVRDADYEKPIARYLLTGRNGAGKSITLTHLAHFGHKAGFVLLHCVSPNTFTRYPQESASSESRPGRMDTPIDAALALQHFRAQNLSAISHLKTSSSYQWSLREKTESGEPLISIIDHGINRLKHSSDCFAALLKELKIAANAGQCKIMLLVDKINLFYWQTLIKQPDRRYAEIDEITVARSWRKMFRQDWKNGILISALDKQTHDEYDPKIQSDRPEDILMEKGMRDLHPFQVIHVDNYTDKEFVSCLAYYDAQKFVHHPAFHTEQGKQEIKFISAQNPLDVYNFCKWL